MAFLAANQLRDLGFMSLGKGVLISDKASIYNPEAIEIGDHSRIDDFCVISGRVSIGRNVHVAVYSNIAGGSEGVVLDDFAGLAYGCQVFSQSDDYSGTTMTNPTVPVEFKSETKKAVRIGRHSILGTSTIVFPGVEVAEGCATAAMSVVTKSTEPWSIYVGNPAKRVKRRSQSLLELEKRYLASSGTD